MLTMSVGVLERNGGGPPSMSYDIEYYTNPLSSYRPTSNLTADATHLTSLHRHRKVLSSSVDQDFSLRQRNSMVKAWPWTIPSEAAVTRPTSPYGIS